MKAIEYTLKATKQAFNSQKILSSADAVKFARNFYHDDIMIYESVFIILMNSNNRAIGYAKISQGGVCSTVVDVKIIAKYAIDSLAVGVILVHNHPSGNASPSGNDTNVASRLKEVLRLMEVSLLDNIIITEESHYSMADEGTL